MINIPERNKKTPALMITPRIEGLEEIRAMFYDEVPFYPDLDTYQLIAPEMFVFGDFRFDNNKYKFIKDRFFFTEDTKVLELYRLAIANKYMKIIDSFYVGSTPKIEYCFQAYRQAQINLKNSISEALCTERKRIDIWGEIR